MEVGLYGTTGAHARRHVILVLNPDQELVQTHLFNTVGLHVQDPTQILLLVQLLCVLVCYLLKNYFFPKCTKIGHFFQLVDGGWASWNNWSSCSKTCDPGITTRSRTCTNPPVQYSGAQCPGSNTDTAACTVVMCPSMLPSQKLFFSNVN